MRKAGRSYGVKKGGGGWGNPVEPFVKPELNGEEHPLSFASTYFMDFFL